MQVPSSLSPMHQTFSRYMKHFTFLQREEKSH